MLFATKTNKNNVNANKWKLLNSFLGRLSVTIPRLKSMTHSIAFCLPVGFNLRFLVKSKLRRKQSNRSVTPLYKLYHQTKLVQCGTLASVHPIHFTSFPRNSHKINSCAYLVFSNRFLTTRYHTTMKQKIQNIFMKIRHFFISVKNEANFSPCTVLLI